MEEAYNYLLNDINIKYGDSVVLGVSGGPDSMALLHLMTRLKKALDIEVVCAHVNHNTGRPGQFEEQKFVERFCKQNNIVFETLTIDDYGDDNFHNELIKAVDNSLMTVIMDAVTTVYKESIEQVIYNSDECVRDKLIECHRGIYEGIISSDKRMIEAAIDMHYDVVSDSGILLDMEQDC